MGEQVANNSEPQKIMFLHNEDGVWYLLEEEKKDGLIKSEYLPIGNSLVYPKKWDRKKAAIHFLNYLIDDVEKIKEDADKRLTILKNLKIAEENRK